MKLTAIVEASKGQTKRFEKNNIHSQQLELTQDKKPKWLTNYGYIVGTYQEDGDEVDCFILGKPLEVAHSVEVTPVALIVFDDATKVDDKLICIQKPYNKLLLGMMMNKLLRCIKKTKSNAKVLGVVKDPKLIEAKVLRSQALYRALAGEGYETKD